MCLCRFSGHFFPSIFGSWWIHHRELVHQSESISPSISFRGFTPLYKPLRYFSKFLTNLFTLLN